MTLAVMTKNIVIIVNVRNDVDEFGTFCQYFKISLGQEITAGR